MPHKAIRVPYKAISCRRSAESAMLTKAAGDSANIFLSDEESRFARQQGACNMQAK